MHPVLGRLLGLYRQRFELSMELVMLAKEPGKQAQTRKTGNRSWLLTLAGILFFSATALEASTLRLQLMLQGAKSGGETPVQIAATTGDAGAETTKIVAEAVVPGSVTLDLAKGMAWTISAKGLGLWAPERVVMPLQAEETLQFSLWPTAKLTGTLDLPDGEAMPDELVTKFQPAPSEPADRLRGRVRCPITAQRFRCELPAGELDLGLRARGFVSRYVWAAKLSPAKELDLGRWALQRGGSVVGWVTTTDATTALEHIAVELVPLQDRPRDEETARTGLTRHVVKANERGFFHFPGLSSGSYEAVARYKGFSPARSLPLVVHPNIESELLQPLHLSHPQSVEVLLEPMFDFASRPWQVALLERTGAPYPRQVAGGPALDGNWKEPRVAAGTYSLVVRTETGETWWSEEIVVEDRPVFHSIEIPAVAVRGTLHLGEEPLAAELRFFDTGRRIALESDGEGEFAGILTREGTWKVDVAARDPWLRKRINNVEVRRRPGKKEAELTLTIPDHRIQGRVVDESGQPVAPAGVIAVVLGEDGVRPTRVEKDGTFEIVALAPGTITLTAEATEDRVSDPLTMEIIDRVEPPPVELVVRETVILTGQVTAAQSGLPGVALEITPAERPFATTRPIPVDVMGRFETRIPAGTRELKVSVRARGFALRLFRTALPADHFLEIPLGQNGGDLVVDFPQPLDLDYRAGVYSILVHDGVWTFLGTLQHWATLNGETGPFTSQLRIPRLAPGAYSVCVLEPGRLITALADPTRSQDCVTELVLPQAEARVSLPSKVMGSESSESSGKP